MNISLNWIKNYVETAGISDQEIDDILTLTGLEVEEMEATGTDFENFVVGEVLEVRAHPNADKLQVCRVDQGDGETVQIVCGAPNVADRKSTRLNSSHVAISYAVFCLKQRKRAG